MKKIKLWKSLTKRHFSSHNDKWCKENVYKVDIEICEQTFCDILVIKNGKTYNQPIAYFSRNILDYERNYSTIEKECLAIALGIKAFATYLVGKPFILQTDHRALTWLRTFRDENMRLTRWSLALQPYTFEIQHRKGQDNANADALSRLPGKVKTDQCFALEKEGSNVTDNIRRASGSGRAIGSLNQERS